MGTQLLWKHRKTQRGKGQALVEFALVFPIFLMLVLGVIEVAHLIFVYSSVYVSSREAARYGAAAGFSGNGVQYYRDCAGMRAAAQRVGEYGGVRGQPLNITSPTTVDPAGTGVAIELILNGDTLSQAINFNDCSWVDPDPKKQIEAGDRIRVTTQVQYAYIVPLVPFPKFAVSHTTTRTILRNVDLEKIEAGSPPVADTYGVQLSVPNNSLLGAHGATVTYDLSVKNTGSIFDTYTLVLSGNGWTTTLVTAVSVVPGETVVVPLAVTIPPNVPHGQTDTVTITATSIGDPAVPPASANISLTTRAPMYGVILTTPDNTLGGQAGTNIVYDVTVRNTGDLEDVFNLTLAGNSWATSVASPVTVPAGGQVITQVIVTVPTEFTTGATDTVVVTARSARDPINPPASATLSLTTSAPYYRVAVTANPAAKFGPAGGTVEYDIRITNLGNVPDSYTLSINGNVWATSIDSVNVDDVAPGTYKPVKVSVVIPATATHGNSDRVNIVAVSKLDPTVPPASATLQLITTAFTYGVQLSADPATLMGAPGATVSFNLAVQNIGTVNDTYTLTMTGNTWTTVVTCGSAVSVAAGATVTCPVTVTVPDPVAGGSRSSVTIRATSQGDPSIPPVSASLVLTTNTPRYGILLTVLDDTLSGAPGNNVTYTLAVRNTGNVTDTFGLTVAGLWPPAIIPNTVTLAPGASTALTVTVNIPASALHDAVDVTTVSAYSGNIAAPRATASIPLTTTATRVCPYAGSLGLGTKSMNLLLYNNNTGAEAVTIEQISVTWFMNNATQRLDYITYLGSNIMTTDATGTVNTSVTSSFPANGPWVTGANLALPAVASNYGLNVYFGVGIDTTKTHGIYIRFSNGCFISR